MSENIEIALIGVAGAVIGSVATMASQLIKHCLEARAEASRDRPRKDLLIKMLNHRDRTWREFETLQHVIGADERTTKQLLLEVGARASEDGKPLWGLTSRNPLPNSKQ